MKTSFWKIAVIGMFTLIFGCGTSTQMVKPEQPAKTVKAKPGQIDETFDPMKLDAEDISIKKTVSQESKSDDIDDILLKSESKNQLSENMDGYRVQICAVSDETKAKENQREAIINFIEQGVYLKYDSPYYKVRVGDCVTRYEAEKLQRLAVEKGFVDAWVVRSKIKPAAEKKSTPQINENKPPN